MATQEPRHFLIVGGPSKFSLGDSLLGATQSDYRYLRFTCQIVDRVREIFDMKLRTVSRIDDSGEAFLISGWIIAAGSTLQNWGGMNPGQVVSATYDCRTRAGKMSKQFIGDLL